MYPKVNSLAAAWFVTGNQRTIVKMRREKRKGDAVSFFMGGRLSRTAEAEERQFLISKQSTECQHEYMRRRDREWKPRMAKNKISRKDAKVKTTTADEHGFTQMIVTS